MKTRHALACCLLTILAGIATPPEPSAGLPAAGVSAKRGGTAARLLLPYFEADMAGNPPLTRTLFAVRNEINQPVDVRISYYATDRPQSPLHSETVTLTGKRVLAVDVRSKPNLLIDDDGLARGYAIIESLAGESVLQGDYFQLRPAEGFASGSRLVNIDRTSPDSELCSVFTVRFFNGGGFDGGTLLSFWLDLDHAPEDTPVLSYAVYSEAGDLRLFVPDVPANQVAFRLRASDLVSLDPIDFGAIEFQFVDGIRGHIAATMSALGLYSVGLEAVCLG